MKSLLIAVGMLLSAVLLHAQDVTILLNDGRRLEQQLKENEAIVKYEEVLKLEPANQKALNKITELTLNIGARQPADTTKMKYYKKALLNGMQAVQLSPADAETLYWMAVAYSKIYQAETKKEPMAEAFRLCKDYADKAIAANASFGKAWHMLGQWYLLALNMNGLQKAALKLLYASMPKLDIETAVADMEKCKALEPYYCLNYYDLARAYHFQKRYEKAIDVLQQLAKLPTRRQDDVAIKARGAALLQELQ